MLGAVLFLVVPYAAAASLLLHVAGGTVLSAAEALTIAVPVSTVSSALLAAVAVHHVGKLTAGIAMFPVLVAASIILWRFMPRGPALRTLLALLKQSLRRDWGANAVLLFSVVFYGYMLSTHMLPYIETEHWGCKDGCWWSAGSTWSDLGYHLGIIHSMVHGANEKDLSFTALHNPILAGHDLVYPFVPNFQTVILMSSGLSLRTALIVGSLFMCIALHLSFYYFAVRVAMESVSSYRGKQRLDVQPWVGRASMAAGVLAVLLIVHAGNFGFVKFFFEAKGDPALAHDAAMRHDYNHQYNSSFLSFVPDIIMPQRSSLYAFALCIPALLCMWRALELSTMAHKGANESDNHKHDDDDDDGDGDGRVHHEENTDDDRNASTSASIPPARTPFVLSGVCLGLLPLCQAHTVVAMAALIPAVALASLRRTGLVASFLQWFWLGVPWLLLAVPQLLLYTHRVEAVGFGRYEPFWKTDADAGYLRTMINALWYWPYCIGLLPPLSILALFRSLGGSPLWRRCFAGFASTLWVSSVFMFTPWNGDNIKLVYVFVFGAATGVANMLFHLLCTPNPRSWVAKVPRGWRWLQVAVLVVPLTLTGLLVNWREGNMHHPLWTRPGRDFGEWTVRCTASDAVFLASENHLHPVTTYAGRRVMHGFGGWLWSHGYPEEMRTRQHASEIILAAHTDHATRLKLLHKYHIRYVVVDDRLRHDRKEAAHVAKKHWLRIYGSGDAAPYQVYDVTLKPGDTKDRVLCT